MLTSWLNGSVSPVGTDDESLNLMALKKEREGKREINLLVKNKLMEEPRAPLSFDSCGDKMKS